MCHRSVQEDLSTVVNQVIYNANTSENLKILCLSKVEIVVATLNLAQAALHVPLFTKTAMTVCSA